MALEAPRAPRHAVATTIGVFLVTITLAPRELAAVEFPYAETLQVSSTGKVFVDVQRSGDGVTFGSTVASARVSPGDEEKIHLGASLKRRQWLRANVQNLNHKETQVTIK